MSAQETVLDAVNSELALLRRQTDARFIGIRRWAIGLLISGLIGMIALAARAAWLSARV